MRLNGSRSRRRRVPEPVFRLETAAPNNKLVTDQKLLAPGAEKKLVMLKIGRREKLFKV